MKVLKLGNFTKSVIILMFVLLSVGMTFATTKDTHAALVTAPYTTAELNAKLYGGVQQAIDWDKQCYDGVREERAAGHGERQSINGAPSYKGLQWMSLADSSTQNNGSRTAPIVVDYGTKTVPLQLNMVKFLCAGLVSPDGAGADYPYTDKRVVRFLNNANDRDPNPMGGDVNWPAMTDTRFRIDNIQVVQGDGHIQGTAIGKYIGTARQENTRYWFADPTKFNFVADSPDGLTEDVVVKIKFTLRGYNTYYHNIYQCYANDLYTYPPNDLNINNCDQNSVTLSVRINVRDFDLTPTATLNQSSIEAGGTANVGNTVQQSDIGTMSGETDWRLTELNYAPGKTLSAAEKQAQDSVADPCGAFTSNGRTACTTAQRNDTMIFRDPTTVFDPLYGYTAPPDIPPGTKVCFVASVSRPTPALSPVWRHSAMVCMTVSKKPKLQVWGGDVATRGKIETSTKVKAVDGTAKVFGSWVEYGAFSVGTNSRFASGSGLNGGNADTEQAAWSKLTFANKNALGADAFGSYTTLTGFRPVPRIAAYFGSLQNTQPVGAESVDLGSLASNNSDPIVVRTAGDLTITGGTIPAGRSVVLVTSGTVTIAGDIKYSDATLHSPNDIPQVVIIANNINIHDNVQNVDSWLVASDTINTCKNFSGNLTIGKCGNKLTVNGPVVSDHLILNRTGGDDEGDPAEKFNLRPDAYLWAELQASGSNKAQTVYSTELPPRF
jgi:hypothetical protein